MVFLFWLISVEKYDQIRKIENCDKLENLKATKKDKQYIIEIADRMGIKKEHRWISTDPTFEELKESEKEIRSK